MNPKKLYLGGYYELYQSRRGSAKRINRNYSATNKGDTLYVNGKAIYIPSTSKKEWGSHTDTRQYLIQRNHEISQKYQGGSSIASLAMQFSLSEKSIQRIVREGKRKSGKL